MRTLDSGQCLQSPDAPSVDRRAGKDECNGDCSLVGKSCPITAGVEPALSSGVESANFLQTFGSSITHYLSHCSFVRRNCILDTVPGLPHQIANGENRCDCLIIRHRNSPLLMVRFAGPD